MAALDFPSSPTLNQTYTANGLTWKWDGTSWVTQNAGLTGTVQVSEGGTGATDSAGARANLGLDIGVDVQAWSADLDAIDALAGTSGFLKKTAANTWSLDTSTYLTSVTKADIGLGSVENTALSTWAGSANITTLGTVATGTWSATAIAVAKGGTGATDAGTARTNLGLAIGTNVQAYSADLAAIDALAGTSGFLKKTATDTWALDTNTYLTGNQSISISGDASGSGTTSISLTLATVGITKGGTGQTTAAAAFNALSPLTTLGDIIYASGANTAARLAGNTTSTRQFLRQTGTGTVSAAPAWDTVTKTDVGLSAVENTALSTWAGSANITTVGTIATGTWSATAIAVAKGGTGATTAAAALTNLGAVALAGSTMTGQLGVDVAGNQIYLHNGSASSTPTVIHRNDGANYYILLSAAGTISGTWNTLRPLYINCTTGALSSANGQTFTGGCSVDTLSIGGFAAIHVNNVNSYAPTLTGVGATGSWGINVTGSSASCTGTAAYATAVSGVAGLCGYSVSGQAIAYTGAGGPYPQAQSSGAAMMSFHRPAVYGINFGLDTDNVLKVGGWSMGAVAYPILHSGNSTSYASSNGWKLWVRFSGTTISASSGMTSITVYSGTIYNINFSITLSDANYCTQFTINEGATYTTRYAGIIGDQNTTYCRAYTYGFAPTGAIVVFR